MQILNGPWLPGHRPRRTPARRSAGSNAPGRGAARAGAGHHSAGSSRAITGWRGTGTLRLPRTARRANARCWLRRRGLPGRGLGQRHAAGGYEGGETPFELDVTAAGGPAARTCWPCACSTPPTSRSTAWCWRRSRTATRWFRRAAAARSTAAASSIPSSCSSSRRRYRRRLRPARPGHGRIAVSVTVRNAGAAAVTGVA